MTGAESGDDEPNMDAQMLDGLRDFQRDTARYVHQRLFGAGPNSTSRFLVADEVGLGKTLVARGVIAQAVKYLRAAGDERIDIVYVASNSVIARQNVRKLAPTGIEVQPHTGRLSLLPYTIGSLSDGSVNLIALTPQTSLDLRSQGGTFRERAGAFAALKCVLGGHRMRGTGVALIFAGGIGPYAGISPQQRLRDKSREFPPLEGESLDLLREAIRSIDAKRAEAGLPSVDGELHSLAPHFLGGRTSDVQKARRARLIREIREAMSWTGVQLLRPDLVILDEFQRFKNLLDDGDEGWTSQIARAMFNYEHKDFDRTTRVLLLSATPYVMHTTTAEAASGSDVHYRDFLATYRFLAAGLPNGEPSAQDALLRERLSRVRESILDAEITGAEPVRDATNAVSDQLTEVMVRTDRLSATVDHDGMLATRHDPVGVPSAESLGQYIDVATLARFVARGSKSGPTDVMDYWKSAPYTVSFLGGHKYALSHAIREQTEAPATHSQIMKLLRSSRAVLPWAHVAAYRELNPANGRMQRLWSDMFDADAHRLLWLPPSCRYYVFGGRFDTPAARRLTKRLVFSAWTVVPTVVSTLTSYEAERRLHNDAKSNGASVTKYTKDTKRHNQHLLLRSGTQSMSTLIFQLPSRVLADWGDALTIRAEIGVGDSEIEYEELVRHVRTKISNRLRGLIPSERANRGGSVAGTTGWYTLAPLLLDARTVAGDDYHRSDDLGSADPPCILEGGWLAGGGTEVRTPKRYLQQLQEWFDVLTDAGDGTEVDLSDASAEALGLPPVPHDLEDVMARTALAGPPTAIFRSLSRHFPDIAINIRLDQAAIAARGFISLFNSWEATRIIDATVDPGDFWRKALDYCAEGHLQAMLDEYVAALIEWRGYDRDSDREKAIRQTAEDISEAVSLRTSTYDILRPSGEGIATGSMRGRFAVRYGKAKAEDKSEQRAEAVALSFNSPFWPFVLTTTSVGQEGLDFHLYCHAVSHWNLPSNPVDLEQREGRVHRHKGHAVRKNVATAMGVPSGEGEPWKELFAKADESTADTRDSQLVPYWVFAPSSVPSEDLAKIERHLPITPFSREASRLDPLLASVAYYRLAFGQPRQEELVKHVLNRIEDAELRDELSRIRVDLTPPKDGD